MPGIPTWAALLIVFVGVPLLVVVPDLLLGASPGVGVQVLLQLLFCGSAGLVLWIAVRCERLPLRSLGLRRPDGATLVSGVLLWLATAYVLPRITAPLLSLVGTQGPDRGLERLAHLPTWFLVVLGVTSGAVEEILFRGYAIERLSTITGRRWLGAAISALGFGLVHVPYWGIGFALAADLPFGVAMTLFYLWRRDLCANILAHSTGLVVSLLTAVP